MRKRNPKGQSMVEYALGLGCVAALVMVALGSVGHICGDMVTAIQNAINYGGTTAPDPGRTIRTGSTPWVLN